MEGSGAARTSGDPASRHIPFWLSRAQRVVSGVFGLVLLGGGGSAVFLTDNQAGATTLLLLGGLGALMSLTGRVPERMGREGIAYEPVEVPAATSAMGELMSDEQPHVIREAAAAVYDQQLASYESESGVVPRAELTAAVRRLRAESIGMQFENAVESELRRRYLVNSRVVQRDRQVDLLLARPGDSDSAELPIEIKYSLHGPLPLASTAGQMRALVGAYGAAVMVFGHPGEAVSFGVWQTLSELQNVVFVSVFWKPETGFGPGEVDRLHAVVEDGWHLLKQPDSN